MGVPLVLFAFVATVVGGMGSLAGAVLGGFIVGVASVFFQVVLPIDWRPNRDVWVYGMILLILLLRPSGLVKVKVGRGARLGGAREPDPGAGPQLLDAAGAGPDPAWRSRSWSRATGDGVLARTVTDAWIRAVLVVGLYIFIGNAGVLVFGHIAFTLIGAYATAWLTLSVFKKSFACSCRRSSRAISTRSCRRRSRRRRSQHWSR